MTTMVQVSWVWRLAASVLLVGLAPLTVAAIAERPGPLAWAAGFGLFLVATWWADAEARRAKRIAVRLVVIGALFIAATPVAAVVLTPAHEVELPSVTLALTCVLFLVGGAMVFAAGEAVAVHNGRRSQFGF